MTVRQEVTPVTVRFADDAVADFFDNCVDRGLHVEQFSRIWIHTHPGESVTPSGTDEENFQPFFRQVRLVAHVHPGSNGQIYARLAFSLDPRQSSPCPPRLIGQPGPSGRLPRKGCSKPKWHIGKKSTTRISTARSARPHFERTTIGGRITPTPPNLMRRLMNSQIITSTEHSPPAVRSSDRDLRSEI